MSGSDKPGTLVIQALDSDRSNTGSNRHFRLVGSPAKHPIQQVEIDPDTSYPLTPSAKTLNDFSLTIYHFNDLHGHLVRFTPEGDLPILSRISGELKQARSAIEGRKEQGIMVLSAGDDCSGSIFDELAYHDHGDLPENPCYQIYSKIGLDAACIGNHDLDQGLEKLLGDIQAYADFPVLAANLQYNPELPQIIYPGAIVIINQVRVGLIGLVTRAETRLKVDEGKVVDPIPVARNMVQAIKPYCDLVIVLSHLGYCLDQSDVPMADAGDAQLAKSLPTGSVDLVVGGHSHTGLNQESFKNNNLINGIPIVQAGQKGEFLGRASLQIQEGKGETRDAKLLPIDQLPNDHVLYDQDIKPVVEWAQDLMSRQIGRIDNQLKISAEEVRQQFDTGEFSLANFINDAFCERLQMRGIDLDFTMLDLSSIHCGFSKSDQILFGDCFEMMPYPDIVRIYKFTGTQLITLLEDNARRLRGTTQALVDRGFFQFSKQIRYKIRKGIERINSTSHEMTFEGRPLQDMADRKFNVGTTCFSRVLSAEWEQSLISEPIVLEDYPYQDLDIILRHEVVAYIRSMGENTANGSGYLDGRLEILN